MCVTFCGCQTSRDAEVTVTADSWQGNGMDGKTFHHFPTEPSVVENLVMCSARWGYANVKPGSLAAEKSAFICEGGRGMLMDCLEWAGLLVITTRHTMPYRIQYILRGVFPVRPPPPPVTPSPIPSHPKPVAQRKNLKTQWNNLCSIFRGKMEVLSNSCTQLHGQLYLKYEIIMADPIYNG